MPTYQYACTECDHHFERFQSFNDDALTRCPECEGRLRKVFNAVGVVFKGSGFYRTDSRAEKSSADGSSSGAASSGAASPAKESAGKGAASSGESSSGSTSSASSSSSSSSESSGSSGSSGSGSAPAKESRRHSKDASKSSPSTS